MAYTPNQEFVTSPEKRGTGFDKHTVCRVLVAELFPCFGISFFPIFA